MEGFVKQSFLYDFYGDLLTEHQKEIYESYIQDNLSLAEIAEETGVSRQAVHDVIKRCNVLLEGYEERLHLVEKFVEVRSLAKEIEKCESLDEAKKIASEIAEKF